MPMPRRAIEAGSGTADTWTKTPPPLAPAEKPVTMAPANFTALGAPLAAKEKSTNPDPDGEKVILTSSPTTVYATPLRLVLIVLGAEIVPVPDE
jgi:hypothetical protein